MINAIRELIQYRQLLLSFTYREIRVKYKQSVMGILWAVFMPAVIVSAGVLVKYGYAVVSKSPFTFDSIAVVSIKSVPWAFFVSSIRFASTSLIGNHNLVTKIYFPRAIFPIAAVLSPGFDFLIASALLAICLVIAGIELSLYALFVPVLLVILFAFMIGLAMIVSAGSLFFRDVKYLVEVVLTFAIFFTPVFYEAELFGRYAKYLLLNPVAPILEGLKSCIVDQSAPDPAWLAYSAACAAVTLVGGFALFKKLEPAFAESI